MTKWNLKEENNVNNLSFSPEEAVKLNIFWPSVIKENNNVPNFPENLYRATIQDKEFYSIFFTKSVDDAQWLLEMLYDTRKNISQNLMEDVNGK